MSDRTTELMRLCFEKIDSEGEDAVFFQNVMNALFEARHESECRARLDEALVWFDKWRSKHATSPGHPTESRC
jgi:Ca2+-binding EF-hand superfamily protein